MSAKSFTIVNSTVSSKISILDGKAGTTPTSSSLPGPYDILISRSNTAHNHIGNRRFKIIVELNTETYSLAEDKTDKSLIVAAVIDVVKSAGGAFLHKNRTTGRWELAPKALAREKVGHILRSAVKEASNDKRTIYDIIAATGSKNSSKISNSKKKKLSAESIRMPAKATLSSMLMESLVSPIAISDTAMEQHQEEDMDKMHLLDSFLLANEDHRSIESQQENCNLSDFSTHLFELTSNEALDTAKQSDERSPSPAQVAHFAAV